MSSKTTATVMAGLAALAAAAPAQQYDLRASPFKYVASISVDGLHQSDIDKYLAARPTSNISSLINSGYQFTDSYSSAPSDSFPGTVAIWSGAEPRLSGVFYDDSYSYLLFPPGSACKGPRGTSVVYDEAIDRDPTQLYTSIDPAKLPLALKDGHCEPVYPHQYLRTNTAFEIIQSHGLETAYTDKHPAYDLVRGPSGKGLTTGYFPENAAIASGVASAITYDRLHTDAVLAWLDGATPAHSEGTLTKAPALYGANYQALNVAQKAVGGGYLAAPGNPPSAQVLQALDSIDAAIGAIVAKLKAKHVYDDTLISLAGKHGNSPIDPTLFRTVSPAGLSAAIKEPVAQITADDVALIWLNRTEDSAAAASQLAANKAALQIDYILTGGNLTAAGFGVAGADERVPDIIVQPQHGVIYTNSKKKIAEHGGLLEDDRHVATILSSSRFVKASFPQRVYTTYLAPFFIAALGQNPAELNAVQEGGVPGLPGFGGF